MSINIGYSYWTIVNTDHDQQYTSKEFISLFKSNGIWISMDGAGRCKDNLFVERIHQNLGYITPEEVYRKGTFHDLDNIGRIWVWLSCSDYFPLFVLT